MHRGDHSRLPGEIAVEALVVGLAGLEEDDARARLSKTTGDGRARTAGPHHDVVGLVVVGRSLSHISSNPQGQAMSPEAPRRTQLRTRAALLGCQAGGRAGEAG